MKRFNIYIYILSMVLLMTIFSCKKMFEDEELSMKRIDYTGTELRTDGYYYCRYQYELDSIQNDKFAHRILYRNGVVLSGIIHDFSEMEQVEKSFKDGSYYRRYHDDKAYWGIFQISANKIDFEGWEDNGMNLATCKEHGEILNDTTLRINNAIYHFKQFSPKPDSTNNFIK